jgi:membrane protein DedA with SNARE-associated domain
MLPGVRTLISIPAGLVRIPFPSFFLASFAGAYIWCTVLIGAGYMLGQEWQLISQSIKTHLPFVFGIGFLLIAAYLVYHYRASLALPAWLRQTNKELD